ARRLERKREEKWYYAAETVRDTDVPKIWRVLDPQPPPDVRSVVEHLLSVAGGDHEAKLREALFESVATREQPPAVILLEDAAIVSIPARPRNDRAVLTHDLLADEVP